MNLPELTSGPDHILLRLPPHTTVAVTTRQMAIINHPAFQRLRAVRQLGPTHLVYPGAVHTRFEHSIGVYHQATHYLRRLLNIAEFADTVTAEDARTVLAAALLHDVGHYPFAHSLEALHLKGNDTPRHEDIAAEIFHGEVPFLRGEQTVAQVLAEQWGVDPDRVLGYITKGSKRQVRDVDAMLASIISSGIDADKMDYLTRDSLHMGVPYGLHFDRERLLDSLTLGSARRSIALTSKGKTPAELFAFCRYLMFSEGYWHHAVRSASAMVEAALSNLQAAGCLPASRAAITEDLLRRSDDALLAWLAELAPDGTPASILLAGLTQHRRGLYKRVLELSRKTGTDRHREAYESLMNTSADNLRALTDVIRDTLAVKLDVDLAPGELIIDTPPRDKDHWDDVEIHPAHSWLGPPAPLSETSAVIQGIAGDFVSVVKRTRLFVAPQHAEKLRGAQRKVEDLVLEIILGS